MRATVCVSHGEKVNSSLPNFLASLCLSRVNTFSPTPRSYMAMATVAEASVTNSACSIILPRPHAPRPIFIAGNWKWLWAFEHLLARRDCKCRSNPISAAVFPKTGIFQCPPRLRIGYLRAGTAILSLERPAFAKARIAAFLPVSGIIFSERRTCLAGA